MYRFSKVVYNKASQTAEIGAGLIWDEVYAALDPYGVNVVGGRVSGVGVAGLILGGGLFYHLRMARRNLYPSQVIHGKQISMV